jgi:molybdate transport system ATP-binding protein
VSAALELALRTPLRAFTLDVELESDARALGLFGPSGAGKTTVLEAICGWRRLPRARVRVGGRTLVDSEAGVDVPTGRRRVGYVPQDLLLFPHWDVRTNLLAGGHARAARDPLDEVVEVLELGALLERRVDELSGGERQRVALGRALCAGPDLLLLDEPLASLDLALRRRILPYLVRVRDQLRTPLILVSHDATEVAALCDEVCVLRAGRVALQGRPAEVFSGPDGALAEGAELDNVVRGTVEARAGATATLRLAPGLALQVPAAGLAVGDEALFAIRADDVLVALGRPRGISARNVLDARVADLVRRADEVLVRARLQPDGPRLAAALTPGAVAELRLAAGGEVVLLVKTRACRLLGALAPAGRSSAGSVP